MTTDELRDELARAMGWVSIYRETMTVYSTPDPAYPTAVVGIAVPCGPVVWCRGNDKTMTHPVPPTADAALDAFGRLLPGWTFDKVNGMFLAWNHDFDWSALLPKHNENCFRIPDTGDFTADLMRLTVEAARAMKGTSDAK